MRSLLFPLLLLIPVVLAAQDDPWGDEDWGDEGEGTVWSGFVEAGFGTRFQRDLRLGDRDTLTEVRLRTETEKPFGASVLGWSGEVGYDGIEEEWLLEVRDLSLQTPLGSSLELKLGRQVQTWGTGDLLFLNDLFPKDFVSFFAGRDDEYLKAPADALRLTAYLSKLNVDFVWTPVFTPNVYLTGERFSFFSGLDKGLVAPEPPLSARDPARTPANGEFALRLFRTVKSRELALYGYRGFFKGPSSLGDVNLDSGERAVVPTFAPLNSIGGSLRQTTGPGLLNLEFAYYDSIDDRQGTDPRIPNDQLRTLVGYEWEARKGLTVGLQYAVDWTLDHDALYRHSPEPKLEPDEFRHLLTNRLTYRSGLERIVLSLFTFCSPSDQDYYLRPSVSYRHSDRWSMTVGANLLGGDQQHTFFAQLEDASNAYLRLRYSY